MVAGAVRVSLRRHRWHHARKLRSAGAGGRGFPRRQRRRVEWGRGGCGESVSRGDSSGNGLIGMSRGARMLKNFKLADLFTVSRIGAAPVAAWIVLEGHRDAFFVQIGRAHV